MFLTRRALIGTATAAVALPYARARARPSADLRLGMIEATFSSADCATCARQAVHEFTAGKDLTVELLVTEHQNKADIAAAIARQWIDQDKVDAIVEVAFSPAALAVNEICREKNKPLLLSNTGTTELTGKRCAPTTVQWTFDIYMLAKSIGGAVVKAGGDSWFFIYPDYTFGQELTSDTSRVVTQAGGKVLGSVGHPLLANADFARLVRQAADSGAKVLGLCNFGDDLTAAVKAIHAQGLQNKMQVACLVLTAGQAYDIGLELTQGLVETETFYWDLNDRTRAFTKRIGSKMESVEAGCYAATLHYLKAVSDMGVTAAKADGAAVVARMKKMPTDDDCFGQGYIREDGRKMHPAYLFKVKTPAESKGEWDLLKLVATTPAEQAFRPLSEGGCPLVQHT